MNAQFNSWTIPQTEAKPEGFPKTNTMPDGWNLSDLLVEEAREEQTREQTAEQVKQVRVV